MPCTKLDRESGGAPVADAGLPRLIGAANGSRIAVIRPGHVLVLQLPDLAPLAEVGFDGSLHETDVAFVGDRGHMLVATRGGGATQLYLVDPAGPTKLAQTSLPYLARIAVATGDHVLITGPGANLIFDVSRSELAGKPLAVRGVITAAGRGEAESFVIASTGLIERWNALTRTPSHRLRLERRIATVHVGADDERIWMIPEDNRRHVEIVSEARRSTRTLELPEPAARVSVGTRGDPLLVIGAETRAAYVVNLSSGAGPTRVGRGPMADAIWLGDEATVVLLPVDGPLELFALGATSPPHRSSTDVRAAVEDLDEPAPAEVLAPDPAPLESASDRLAAWHRRVHERAGTPTPENIKVPRHGIDPHARDGGWRAALAAWARQMAARSYRPAPEVDLDVADEISARLGLAAELRPAIWLLYGAYLDGDASVAPLDLAAALDWNWDEVLGDGMLRTSGLVSTRRGRVRLADEALAALDGRPPRTGALVRAGEGNGATVALVAPSDLETSRLAAWAAPTVGTLLAPGPLGERVPQRFVLEARIRGVAPLVPWTRFSGALEVPPPTSAIVVEAPAIAEALAVPVVATWPTAER